MAQEQTARGRPRRAETDAAITRAALELVQERGPGGVNVAAVADRSGIARTTIYRRFRDRTDLLRAALQPAVASAPPPPGLSVRDKLVWVLTRTQEVLVESIGVGGLAAAVADSDPEFSAALRACLDAALEPIQQQIRDDVAHGSLAAHADADLVVNLVLGSYLAELVRHGTTRPGWVTRTADLLAAASSPRDVDVDQTSTP